ncbi:MAG: ornithine carbamoyltransferase [Verrucomicrobia bacterium]|nr:ornithine carbamoyltransferase [Verrucomicrobiota bacterium]MDA1066529.1 ornithine carbamoyltransferase [Verrucomicrobiota bacterium]
MKHFLKSTDFKHSEVEEVFSLAKQFKKQRGHKTHSILDGQSWGMLFFKSSTRTRVSFEVGIHELGGNALYLNKNDIQISRGEPIADTAKVLSRYLHGIIIRCYEHSLLEEFAAEGSIPVVNALSDFLHPCQIYSDAFTMAERWSNGGLLLESLKGKKIAFLGDTACNMGNSWMLGAALFGMEIALAGPEGFEPGPHIKETIKQSGLEPTWSYHTDPMEAVEGADAVYTDVWVSMGMEAEKEERLQILNPYQVTQKIMNAAKSDALFLHCLPAHAGEEVTQEVLDSSASVIFDQAENRLHAQKAILAVLANASKK